MNEDLNKDLIFENDRESQIDGIIPDGSEKRRSRPPHVVAVPVNKIIPNPSQARFILPPQIEEKFYNRQLNCFEAGREFLKIAVSDPVLNNLTEELLRLGRSIEESGQILPVVGAWERSELGDLFFNLFLGSRRFWGVVLNSLQDKDGGMPSLYALEAGITRTDDLSVLNIHQSSLSVIEQSRAVAGLVVNRLGIKKENDETELEHLRKYFSKRRIPKKVWKEVKEVFGLDQEHARELLNYLNLPDQVLYFAATAGLTEEDLQELIGLDENEQVVEIKNIYMRRVVSNEEISLDLPEMVETRSEAEVITEAIRHWFDLSEERGSQGDFMDVAALLMEQIGDDYELELLSRRLINLARDIRVTKTRI
jgi:hypothetical protein